MSSQLQSIVALAIVVLAAAWLARRALAKRRNPGCGDDCGAVSPEIKRLQAKLRKR